MFEQMSLTTCTFETKNCGTIVSENAALELSIFAALMLSDNKWLMYEAGALSKKSQISRIVPVFFNRDIENIEEPLKPFHHIQFNKEDFLNLVLSIKKAQFLEIELKPQLIDQLKNQVDIYWGSFEKEVNDILKEHNNIEQISENVQTLMMDENAYEKILSKREAHLEELIHNLPTDKSERLILFGGISTKIRQEESINNLAIWLINNSNSKIFICHESNEVAEKRAKDLSKTALNTNQNITKEIIKRKVDDLNSMKSKLYSTIGDLYKKNIFFIEIVKTPSIYVTIHGQIMYFTPVLDKRSSNTFTFKLKQSSLLNEVIDYIESRIEANESNKVFLNELTKIKTENKQMLC